jgi:hypothetical protein
MVFILKIVKIFPCCPIRSWVKSPKDLVSSVASKTHIKIIHPKKNKPISEKIKSKIRL